MTDRTRPVSQSGTGSAGAADSATVEFGDLPSVRAMAGGVDRNSWTRSGAT